VTYSQPITDTIERRSCDTHTANHKHDIHTATYSNHPAYSQSYMQHQSRDIDTDNDSNCLTCTWQLTNHAAIATSWYQICLLDRFI